MAKKCRKSSAFCCSDTFSPRYSHVRTHYQLSVYAEIYHQHLHVRRAYSGYSRSLSDAFRTEFGELLLCLGSYALYRKVIGIFGYLFALEL